MHIISRKALTTFAEAHPDASGPLDRWYRVAKRAGWTTFSDLRADLPSADRVDNLVVFTIGGNKFRLVAAVHFARQKLFIRAVLTHHEYDRGSWRE